MISFPQLGPSANAAETSQEAAIELLAPTGRFPVGRTSLHFVDASRDEPGAKPGRKRELMVHVWYPASPQPGATTAPYQPGFDAIAQAVGAEQLQRTAGAAYDGLRRARTHVVADAPLNPKAGKLPVLLLTHGLGYSSLGYSTLSEDLASHGYAVFGIDHPSIAFAMIFPDKRIVRYAEATWNKQRTSEDTLAFERANLERCGADWTFVLNQLGKFESGDLPSPFQGRLDLARVGAMGHSFGGRIAARACQLDKRFKALVVLDGFGRRMPIGPRPDGSTLDQPTMILQPRRIPPLATRVLLKVAGRDREEELAQVRKEFCESVKGATYDLTLTNLEVSHESFCDLPLIESGLTDEARKNRQRPMDLVRLYSRAFFDRALREQAAAVLDAGAEQPPDIELSRHSYDAR